MHDSMAKCKLHSMCVETVQQSAENGGRATQEYVLHRTLALAADKESELSLNIKLAYGVLNLRGFHTLFRDGYQE